MTSSARRAYIDWARGIAVLLMIEAHTIDAWTRAADKRTLAYSYGTILGGFAAPMFLWLAGLGVVLSASRTAERSGSRVEALRTASARGAEIFVLAFLFRLQAFIVSPGGHPIALFRVDVLNVMGPAMIVAALLWFAGRGPSARAALFAVAASATALVTPIVRAASFVERLPLWLQWYVRPAGEFTTFTLLPWAGFVFAGGAVGALLVAGVSGRVTTERRVQIGIGLAGALVIAGGFYAASLPSPYRVPTSFWTSSPAWFAIRVGILMVALAALSSVPPLRVLEPLAVMGRASLFVYWIHVELVYGYASWFWRHRLPLWAWVIAYIAFSVLMYQAIGLRDRFLANRKGPRIPASIPVPQT